MSNWIDLQLDVLAASPAEINQIEAALQESRDELIAWCGQRSGEDPSEIVADIKEIGSGQKQVTDDLGEKLNGIRHANRSEVGIRGLEDLWAQMETQTST